LDKVRGGSICPKVGEGRRKDQCNDPRTQTKVEDNTNYIMRQGNTGDEEITGRAHYYANT
jgi:hypothetical protein